MLNAQSANKLVINLKNEYGAVLRLSSYPIARMVNEYSIKYVDSDYTLNGADFDGFMIVLVDSTAPVTVTMPKVGESIAIGKCVNIGQETENIVTITPSVGVTINPIDALALRRDGSFATLVYEGNERWRFIGELP
ncbi:hypothetical protein ACTXJH_06560 [Psychrobacter celer]|uniref:hypothetical protein n=1 Tax=Psychrobacter celer TaxID=306572 RepID=UPI003FD5BE55